MASLLFILVSMDLFSPPARRCASIIGRYLSDMNKKIVIESIGMLIREIDACIESIVSARLNKDAQQEGRALFKMESLMVGSMQELSFLRDYIEENVK